MRLISLIFLLPSLMGCSRYGAPRPWVHEQTYDNPHRQNLQATLRGSQAFPRHAPTLNPNPPLNPPVRAYPAAPSQPVHAPQPAPYPGYPTYPSHPTYTSQTYRPNCQIYSPTQPIPPGCHPSQVELIITKAKTQARPARSPTISTRKAYNPDNHTSLTERRTLRKPRLRGTLSIGAEKHINGTFLDYARSGHATIPMSYDPDDFTEISMEGSQTDGQVQIHTHNADIENIVAPNIALDNAYDTPFTISAGLEFINTTYTTLFANARYSYARTNNDSHIIVNGELIRTTLTQNYNPTTLAPIGNTQFSASAIPNIEIARFRLDLDPFERIGFEVGLRQYFSPILASDNSQAVSPFVSLSGQAQYYSPTTFDIIQSQLFYTTAYNSLGATQNYYFVNRDQTDRTLLYDGQWTYGGALNAGIEWQASASFALALETGIQYERGRKYANGARQKDNLTIPVTLRASYNF